MVRVHTQLNPGAKDSKLTDVDEGLIDRIWRFVAALKKEGIYDLPVLGDQPRGHALGSRRTYGTVRPVGLVVL
jgi:hypothetical protein